MVDSELMVDDARERSPDGRRATGRLWAGVRRACTHDVHGRSYRRCQQPVKARPPARLSA